MWIDREISETIEKLVRQRPVVLVTGSRQTGKTTLLERTLHGFGYISLDVPAQAERAELAGEAFLADHQPPVIIDEVQYAPHSLWQRAAGAAPCDGRLLVASGRGQRELPRRPFSAARP